MSSNDSNDNNIFKSETVKWNELVVIFNYIYVENPDDAYNYLSNNNKLCKILMNVSCEHDNNVYKYVSNDEKDVRRFFGLVDNLFTSTKKSMGGELHYDIICDIGCEGYNKTTHIFNKEVGNTITKN